MYNNPLKATEAVESESWDKYVEEGKRSHQHKNTTNTTDKSKSKSKDKDPYNSPFAMAGMAFKTDQLPMKKLTVESPYKYDEKMNMAKFSSGYIEEVASGGLSSRLSVDNPMPKHANEIYGGGFGIPSFGKNKKSPNKSKSPLKVVPWGPIITGIASLIGTGVSAAMTSSQARRDEEERRREERRRKLERAQDQVHTSLDSLASTERSRAANVGNWWRG